MQMLLAWLRANLVLRATTARPLAQRLAAAAALASFKIPKRKLHARTARRESTATWLQPLVHPVLRDSTRLRVQAVVLHVMQVESQPPMVQHSARIASPAHTVPR